MTNKGYTLRRGTAKNRSIIKGDLKVQEVLKGKCKANELGNSVGRNRVRLKQ